MTYQVKLDVFEGPFDLLLQLIARRQVEVTDIDLADITADFVAHLGERLDELDLETATRFLVVAATLIELKAARLLPAEERSELEDLIGEARDVLYARLLEYRAFRDVARILDHRLHLHEGLIAREVPLEPWLQTVWKAEGAILNRETTYLGSVLGFAELLLSGVTTVMDMFWYPDETVRAARALGMRVSTGGIFFDPPGVTGHDIQGRIAAAERFFEEFGDSEDVFPAILPHGTYTVSPENLRISKSLAERHGALFCTHAAETRAEQADVTNRYGRSVIRHLEHLGLLDARTVLAHCVHLDDEEIAILARTGASVAHNPMSNLKLASGFARVPDMLEAGINVSLGTDGAISGNDLDMWMALRLAATIHKANTGRADVISTTEALAMATAAGAKALDAADRIGSLEEGKYADMILIDTGAGNKEDSKFHDIYAVDNRGADGRTRLEDGLRQLGAADSVAVNAPAWSNR
jgi:cytosine/adenosine deaminase-related metal-dependent hydrolase